MKELYINSILVELDEKTSLDLQFTSFLFSSINSISAPRSWTVSLPLTAKNLAMIQGSKSSDYSGDFPYKNWTVDYYDMGLRLINSGKAILTKLTDRIEFVFTFGKVFEVIKLMTEKKLTELTETTAELLNWNSAINLNDMSSGIGWCNFFSFTNEDRSYTGQVGIEVPESVLHPTILLSWLIDKIGTEFSFDLSSLSGNQLLADIGFPIRKSDGVGVGTPKGLAFTVDSIGVGGIVYFLSTGRNDIFYEADLGGGVFSELKLKETVLETIKVNVVNTFYISPTAPEGQLFLKVNGTTVAFTENQSTDPLYELYAFDEEINLVAGDEITFVMFNKTSLYGPSSNSSVNSTYYIKKSYYGDSFVIIPNLPDMTCADFIFQCMQFCGVFPLVDPTDETVINFFSASVLYDNISSAKDWTDKLVKSTRSMSDLSDVEFKFGSYAKSNTLDYKNTTGEGVITVDNENLEQTSKLVDLKFAKPDTFSESNLVIDYPLYDIKIDGTTLIRNAKSQSDDVIAKVVNISSKNYLQFTSDLKFSAIVANDNYTDYQKLILKPRYLKEKFYLKQSDIYNLNLIAPIYLQQFGKYYAIMKLTYREKEFSECELLEIKSI